MVYVCLLFHTNSEKRAEPALHTYEDGTFNPELMHQFPLLGMLNLQAPACFPLLVYLSLSDCI